MATWLKAPVPRTSPLRWRACAQPTQRVMDTQLHIQDEAIELRRGHEVLRHAIGTPPRMPWGEPGDSAYVHSPDGRWLWALHYADERARVSLFERTKLRCVGCLDPQTLDLASRESVVISHWGELSTVVSPLFPERIIIHANIGDDVYLALALEASTAGIVDRGGLPLFDAIASRLDATLWSAAHLSSDRLLVLDDIGILSVLSYPEGEHLLSYNLLGALRDPDTRELCLWPEDGDADLVVGEAVMVVGEHLLLNLCTNDSAFELEGVVVLDRHTLEPRGLLPPPAAGLGQLSMLDTQRVRDPRSGSCYALEPA